MPGPVRARYAHAVVRCAVHEVQAPPATAGGRGRGVGHRDARCGDAGACPGRACGRAARVLRDRPRAHAAEISYDLRDQRERAMGGTTPDNRLARIDGKTVTPISSVRHGYLTGISDSGTMVGQQNDQCDPRRRHDGDAAARRRWQQRVRRTRSTAPGHDRRRTPIDGDQIAWVDGGRHHDATAGASTATTRTRTRQDQQLRPDRRDGIQAGDGRVQVRHVAERRHRRPRDVRRRSGSVQDMNDAGQFIARTRARVATAMRSSGTATTVVDLGTLGGSSTYAQDINDAGQIACTSSDAAATPMRCCGRTGRSTTWAAWRDDAYAQGINDQGQVTGGSNTADGKSHGFLVDHGVMYDINDLLPAHRSRSPSADRITDSGYILACSECRVRPAGPRAPAPAARYDVIDLGNGLARPSNDIAPIDMNAARHVIGPVSTSSAFMYDGTTAFDAVPELRSRAAPAHQRERRHRRHRTAQRPSGGLHATTGPSTSSGRSAEPGAIARTSTTPATSSARPRTAAA